MDDARRPQGFCANRKMGGERRWFLKAAYMLNPVSARPQLNPARVCAMSSRSRATGMVRAPRFWHNAQLA